MKDDMISRQAAVTALNGCTEIYLNNLPPTIYKEDAIKAVKALPSATDTNVGDMISRQAAINALKNRWKKTRNYEGIGDDIAEECELYLKQVPSAQPGWIPTSVKPPEPFKLVLIQDSCGCYELNTYIPPRINPKQYPNGYWGEVGNVDFDYFDVEAWCTLPAPYCPEGEEHERFD